MDAQDGLHLCYSHSPEDRFSRVEAQLRNDSIFRRTEKADQIGLMPKREYDQKLNHNRNPQTNPRHSEDEAQNINNTWYQEDNWASSRENLSSGFPSKRVSNQSHKLQRLARKLKLYLKVTYSTFQKANNKGADQTVRMRRLVCACVVRKPLKTDFFASRPN